MRRIISSGEMAVLDRETQHTFHLPGNILMENAGLRGWQFIEKRTVVPASGGPLIFIAGPGNNGGDCLVMARHAFEKYPARVVVVYVCGDHGRKESAQTGIIDALEIPAFCWPREKLSIEEKLQCAAVLIDGISGIGIKGELRETAAALVVLANRTAAYRIAVDVPSGITDGFKKDFPCFHAHLTLTMGLPKKALYLPEAREACGEIAVINPGFPRQVLENNDKGDVLYSFDDFALPEIAETAYKTKRGHAAVFAGTAGFTGAAVLSSSAAARVRTGLVTLHVDDSLYAPLVSACRSVMIKPLSGPFSGENLLPFSAYLAGPGWGRKGREEYLRMLLESPLPGVVDADGIHHLASLLRRGDLRRKGPCVITPHPGELAEFSGISKEKILEDPLSFIKELSVTNNLVVVLKSHVTFIAAPDGRSGIIDGMNPSLGTGGSGDILAGIITGFLAQGIPPFEASVQGVLLHQQAGKICFEEKGWFLSEDLLPYLSLLIKKAGF